MPKIIDDITKAVEAETPFFSLEFFPPRTEVGAANLFDRFDRLAGGTPLFIDITWGAGGGTPSDDKVTSSMQVAATAVNYCGLPTMLHLTCTDSNKDDLRATLNKAKEHGIRNILALRGDPVGEDWETVEDGFCYAVDLVKFIKKEFGDFFGICVAGYPNGHPDCESLEEDIIYLKDKVDAGAEFIITQLFFETETFIEFHDRCRAVGITCPIIPGILPIQGYASLRHLVKLSKLRPPQHIIDAIEQLKDDDAAILEYGVGLSVKMIQELLQFGVPGFHIYTLNREVATKKILQQVNLWANCPCASKDMPWKTSANEKRCNEEIRPINWACRPKSYLVRTREWDDFPNGRWGDSSSPAFGDLSGYHIFKPSTTKKKVVNMWGDPETLQDICTVFQQYLQANTAVKRMPWSESSEMSPETETIRSQLLMLNGNGIFTTNSQPAVNGLPSTHAVHGWGGEGGYVYQKAYVEFFISPERMEKLVAILANHPTISFLAMNNAGELQTNTTATSERQVIAVTWGVFPNKEIIQPTVLDSNSFPIWKEEAFGLWKSEWGALCKEDGPGRKLIDDIHDNWWLVDLVDNDFVNGDIFKPFFELLWT